MTPTITLPDSTVIDSFQLRMTVFEILHASKNLKSVSFNQLRRDCECRLHLPDKCLDGSAIKELLTVFFSEFLDIREIHNNRQAKVSCEVLAYDSTVVESDFVVKVFTEYVAIHELNITDIEFKSTRRSRHAVWKTLMTLVPHIPEIELQAIIGDSLKRKDSEPNKLSGKNSNQSKNDSTCDAPIEITKNCDRKSVRLKKNIGLSIDNVQSPSACIAMKSTFSTLKWLECIQQRALMRPIINTFSSGAQHVSDLVWADIDKELNLPYSYSAKRWNIIVKSISAKLSFPKKLEKLYEQHSASAEEKVTSSCATSSSTASSKRKERSRSLSDDDSNNNSISDDGGAVRSNVASKTLQIRKKDKVESSKGAKKTPLGNILSSLLRKKEGFTIHQDPGSASPSHEKASGGVAAELSGAKGITTGNSDHHTSIPTHSAEEAAAIPRLVDSTDPATSERKEVASDTVSDPSERRGDAGYTEKKKRKLFRIQRRLRKIVRAQARERTDARATVR